MHVDKLSIREEPGGIRQITPSHSRFINLLNRNDCQGDRLAERELCLHEVQMA